MPYVVLGCGAIGGTVAACLARDGHDVLVSDPDPAVVAAVSAGGLRVEGPAGSFTVAVPAAAPDDLPPRLDGPVLVAVRAQDMAARGRAPGRAPRRRRVRRLPAPRPGRRRIARPRPSVPGRRRGGVGRLRRRPNSGPGWCGVGDRATLLVGELDGLDTERAGLLASHIPGAQLTERILGCLQSGLAQDAVLAVTGLSDQPAAEVLGDPRYRPLLHEVAREVLAGAPVPPAPAGGFDPADLPGSLARLAQASLRSANPHSEVYLDLAVRHRPGRPARRPGRTRRPPGPAARRAASGPSSRAGARARRRTWTCWPRTSGWNGSAGRSTRSAR